MSDEKPKETSYGYGLAYQAKQLEKYKNREQTHWKLRIELARRLVEQHVLPRFAGKPPAAITVVDVGCSIGTFAVEFAKWGYRAYGIDFDPAAITGARELARQENVKAEFVCGDIAEWPHDFPPIDIAVCFDIFEHLHDDEMGALLAAIRKQFSAAGCLVFHTCPTQFDYLFLGRVWLHWPLVLLRWLPPAAFTKVVKAYGRLVDIGLLALKGVTYQELIKREGHCNPTTLERLADVLQRSGYQLLHVECAQLYPGYARVEARFAGQPISRMNLYGVAIPKPA
ncbi:MAG: methyltransferase domain-containing protein [Verrucomicrobia bacterium]|nr:methyltransferase domain-containing protein [Verrucomicrobiota bacterium]